MPPEADAQAAEDHASTPAEGGAGAANEDDLSTEEFDRRPAPEGDDEGGEGAGAEGEGGEGAAAGDDDLAEIELEDGSKVKVPKAAQGGYLREADYRQKTMELGEQRRAFESERTSFATQQEESRAALPEEYAKVAIMSHGVAEAQTQVGEFEKIDWATWRAQTLNLPDDDPNKVQYRQYRGAYDAARETLADAQRSLNAAKEDLTTKEAARLEEQATARNTALATARQETGQALKSDGWDQQRFAETASFAVNNLGVTTQELETVTDPRVWKLMDRLRTSEADNAKLRKSSEQNRKAAEQQQAQKSKPAETAKGNAQPARVRDDISTKAWMERRQKQVAQKRA